MSRSWFKTLRFFIFILSVLSLLVWLCFFCFLKDRSAKCGNGSEIVDVSHIRSVSRKKHEHLHEDVVPHSVLDFVDPLEEFEFNEREGTEPVLSFDPDAVPVDDPDTNEHWNWKKNGNAAERVLLEPIHDKWVVVATSEIPTRTLKKYLTFDGWKVVVVAGENTPDPYPNNKNLHFLGVEEQKKMHKKFRTRGGINLGFLYAILHGAKIILDASDKGFPRESSIVVGDENTLLDVVYPLQNGVYFFNPFDYYGERTIWPKGFPLEAYQANIEKGVIFGKCPKQEVFSPVQHFQQDGSPDVGALYGMSHQRRNVFFDKLGKGKVALSRGLLSPFGKNTIFHEAAFFGLLYPSSLGSSVSGVWRGYITQRLLWDQGGLLSIGGPTVEKDLKDTDPWTLSDLLEEERILHDSGRLGDFLIRWKPKTPPTPTAPPTLFDRTMELAMDLHREGLLGEEDVSLTRSWLNDLYALGVKNPSVVSKSEYDPDLTDVSGGGSSVKKKSKSEDLPYRCEEKKKLRIYSNVLMIVTFNNMISKKVVNRNMRFFRRAYSSVFPNMKFCVDISDDYPLDKDLSLSFVDAGYLLYGCVRDLMRKYPDYDGYLHISDDIFFQVWNLNEYPMDLVWKEDTISYVTLEPEDRDRVYHGINEYWGKRYFGQYSQALFHVMETFPEHLKSPGCSEMLFNPKKVPIFFSNSDIYYIPKKHYDQFLQILDHVSQDTLVRMSEFTSALEGGDQVPVGNALFHEIAVNIALHTIADCDTKNNMRIFKPGHAQFRMREIKIDEPLVNQMKMGLFKDFEYLHPLKLSDPDVVKYLLEIIDDKEKLF